MPSVGNGWPNQGQIKLLQACLFSGSSARKAWEEWTKGVNFDEVDPACYKLLPLVSRNLDLPQDATFEKCKGIYRKTWTENHWQWKRILPIFTQLLEANVEKIVLLKGMAMICRYYCDFGVRVIGDIDILIPKTQIGIATTLLSKTGWRQKQMRIDVQKHDHLSHWHALNFTHPSQMQLDIHWSFIEENCPSLDVSVLKEAHLLSTQGLPLYIPDPADLLLQTCIHGVKPSAVPLIRWIADSVTLLKQVENSLNWDRLVELAKMSSVCLPLSLALEYLTEHFAAPIPQATIQQLRKTPSFRLQYLEYRATQQGLPLVAGWHRFCLNRGYLDQMSRLLQIPKYLQTKAQLKSAWFIPFYGIYWIFKRLKKLFD